MARALSRKCIILCTRRTHGDKASVRVKLLGDSEELRMKLIGIQKREKEVVNMQATLANTKKSQVDY